LSEEQPLFEEPLSPIGRMQSGFGSIVCHTKSKKTMEMATNLLMTNLSDKGKPLSTTIAKRNFNNVEHTLIPVMAKMIHSAVRGC
jgi:hypothetical protein